MSYSWYSWKHHMARKIVTNAIFSNTRKACLNWFLEAASTNYTWMYFQNASDVQVMPRKKDTWIKHDNARDFVNEARPFKYVLL